MRLRTFTAPDMPAAMKLVREAMGDLAVIIASEPLNGKKMLRVTAAIDEEDEGAVAHLLKNSAPAKADPAAENLRFEVQNILRFHNVPELFIAKMMRKATEVDMTPLLALHRLKGQDTQLHMLAMEAVLSAYFSFAPLPLEGHKSTTPWRLMLVGPPGIGKTLTVAKIAARFILNNQKLAVITTDNKRAGGIEQLQSFTNILGIPLLVANNRVELQEHLQAIAPTMPVIIDTAGCNPYDTAEMREIHGLSMLESIEPVLVLPAGGDSLEAVDIVEAFRILPIRRLLVTRADTARRFGGILAAAAAHELAFCHVSNSSSINNTLPPLSAALLAQLLLQYRNGEAADRKQ